jgi:selenocysteine lyase/cysteine desulfurase
MTTIGSAGAERVRRLRDGLPATGAGIYLATHVAGPLSAEGMAAVRESDALEERIGRVGPDRAEDLEQREWEARAGVAAVLGSAHGQVILAHGVADATRVACLELLSGRPRGSARDGRDGPGRALLVSALAAPVARSVEAVAGTAGVVVEHVADVEDVAQATSAPGPGVVLVVAPHVDAVGRRLDPVPLAAAARAAGAPLLLDVSLSVGALALDAPSLEAAALVGDVHRWLLGPEGLAFAWLGPELGVDAPAGLRAASGSFARGALLALGRSVGWLLMYVDLPWALARTGDLAAALRERLTAIDGVELLGSDAGSSALMAFRVAGWDAPQVADELSHSVFAITDVHADSVRVSVGAWNLETELDRFVQRLAELAAHTPASLPRRPHLTILRAPLEDGS